MIQMEDRYSRRLDDYVKGNRARLIEIVRNLVRIPSENSPPLGNEKACQEYIATFLERLNWETELYELDEVKGLQENPLFWPGRDYSGRPNVSAHLRGSGQGRSLVLSGHVDTVPVGSGGWTKKPFGGEIEGNRLYGRGSNDMKAGVGASLFVAEALRELELKPSGDLIVESVVDEEFGGVNGTLAGRLKGFNGDAAVIGEPTSLEICPAQRGGHFAHVVFESPGGILSHGRQGVGVIDQVRRFLIGIEEFAELRRRSAGVHELYAHEADPVPVIVTRLFTAPWGMDEPIGIPETCKVQVYWQSMPGESPQNVQTQFEVWLDELIDGLPELFVRKPVVEFPIRMLPPSSISCDEPLVREFLECAGQSLGREPAVVGMDAPCDMYVFHRFGVPAVLWGPKGGNTHTVDEYVEIDSLVDAARVLLRFVCRWCGI